MIPRHATPGRALDVGCGAGGLMVRLSMLGWAVEGVEWDEAAAAIARGTGHQVHAGNAMRLVPELGPYDLVVLNHVIEHLQDPAAALARLAELLAPGGRIVLVYPNPESLGARWFGAWWFGWEAPRHLVLPTVHGMRRLTQRIGLRLLSSRTLSRSAEAHAAYSRAYRAGRMIQLGHPGCDFFDRAFKALEWVGVSAGLAVGEASVVAIGRTGVPQSGPCHQSSEPLALHLPPQ
jgi:SAM-dependent methyltransferase